MEESDTGSPAPASPASLLPQFYDELRGLARGYLAGESGPQTLTATALVHDAWLRMEGGEERRWEGREQFFDTVEEAMRRVLFERAGQKLAAQPAASAPGVLLDGVGGAAEAPAQGDARGAEGLLPLVYEELRKLAAARLADEGAAQTLQATELVHEAWMRLTKGDEAAHFDSQGHFFAAAAEAIRRILIDRARRRKALKRGAGVMALDLEKANVAMETDDETLLLVDEALQKLERGQAAVAELVKLKFFGGMTHAEACAVLKISERTAKRHWAFARAWLYQEIQLLQAG